MAGDQKKNWDMTFMANESYFGESPSLFCVRSADAFKALGLKIILELGAGQGRDTKYLLDNGLTVIAVDFSEISCAQLRQKFGDRLTVVNKDLRKGIDFPAESIDGCYAHMLLTMDFNICIHVNFGTGLVFTVTLNKDIAFHNHCLGLLS